MLDPVCPRNLMFHITEELRICTAWTSILTEVTMYLILHYNDHTTDCYKGSAKLKFKFIFLDGKWICKSLVFKTIPDLTASKRQKENLYYSIVFRHFDPKALDQVKMLASDVYE